MDPQHHEVVVAGAGPVGLLTTLLLAQASIPVTVLESNEEGPTGSDPTGTKALVYQPILFQLLTKAGLLHDMKQAGREVGAPVFRRTKTKEVVLVLPHPPNAPGFLVLPQWRFCQLVENKLQNMKGVKILRGHNVVDFHVEGGYVSVIAETPSAERKEFKASYLIGADGACSSVRKAAGIPFTGETLSSQLVATDVRYPFDKYGYSDTQFMMDPEHFGVVAKIDDKDLWRVSFSMPDEATDKTIHEYLPGKYERMFPGPRPLKYEIVNVAPYRCQQLCAETMAKGRVILVGDAAHLTNPYAGHGLTTGLYDAESLAAALNSVINHRADQSLLTAWSNARLDIYRKVVDPLSRVAFYRVQNPDIESLFENDPLFKSVRQGKMAPPPSLATDVSQLPEFVS